MLITYKTKKKTRKSILSTRDPPYDTGFTEHYVGETESLTPIIKTRRFRTEICTEELLPMKEREQPVVVKIVGVLCWWEVVIDWLEGCGVFFG